MNTWTAKVIDVLENGDAIVELPPDMLQILGWDEGDTLDISIDENNHIILRKVDKDAWQFVDREVPPKDPRRLCV